MCAQWSAEARSEALDERALSGLEGLLEIVGIKVMVENVRTGTHLESWKDRVPDYRSCNTEIVNEMQTNGMENTLVFANLNGGAEL